MRKLYYQFLDLILFSNLFMALCAVTQALVTFKLIECSPYYPLLALLFSSTLFIYNICLFITKPDNPCQSPLLPKRWFYAHSRLMAIVTLMSLFVLLFAFLLLSHKSQILLAGLGILSIGYTLPIFSKGGQRFGLRNIPGIKSLLIAFVWSLSCVLLPIFEAERTNHIVSNSDILILISKRFLFIMALTIPFDIRDLFQDSKSGLKTIPVMFGEKGAYLFCQGLLAGYLILLFIFKNRGVDPDFFALSLTTILMGWLIFKSKLEKNEYYYFFYMDGVLVLQYVLLMAFTLI